MNKRNDILLINPPFQYSQWFSKLGSKLPPIGLAQLASFLRQKGVSVGLCDALNHGMNFQAVCAVVQEVNPKYVGITATTGMIMSAAELASKMKTMFPEIMIIIGGTHISALPEETMERFASFDIGVVGEGEETTLEIIQKGKADESICGIIFKNNDRLVKTAVRPYIQNLDLLPFPAYDLLPGFPEYYKPTPNNYRHLPVSPVISSRGCPFSCTFCDRSVFGQRLRACSTDYLISHIQFLQKRYDIKEICFYDDIFLLDKQKLDAFLTKIHKKHIKISWSCEGRVDQMNEQMLREMKKGGCWQVNYGIESCSQIILDGFRKRITTDQIKKTVRATKNAGLDSRAYLIIGSPVETKDTLEETRRLILDLPLSDIHISYFTPLPGSEIYREIIKEQSIEDYANLDQYMINYIPPQLSREIMSEFMNSLYRQFYFQPKRIFRYGLLLFNRHKTVHLLRSVLEFIKLIFSKAG